MMVQADDCAVKGSSESMEEVTRVSHFVGSSVKETKGEKRWELGVEVRPSGERVMLPTSS